MHINNIPVFSLFPILALIILSGCAAFSPDAPEDSNAPIPVQGFETEIVAQDLQIPWAIAFLPDGKMIFTERAGKLKILQGSEVHEIEGVVHLGESGLQGLAIDPDFSKNNHIYLYYTYSEGAQLYNRVSRFTLRENALLDELPLLEKIPGNVYHDGGRIKFGPDAKLYISTGDAGTTSLSQDKTSIAGKILRINSDGTIPQDNPFRNAVYSYGHRNPQGFDWHPQSGMLVATEHGPSLHDEVNIILKGANYGWPTKLCSQGETSAEFKEAVVCFADWTMAPSGAAFYSGTVLSFQNAFLYGGLRGEQIRIARFDGSALASDEKLLDGFGRIRDIVQGPDGYIYFATNNTDGRGSPMSQDDKILRIKPKQ
ncbi:MAG TPA: PQQ-dependent sugar dehydrogenase [archaeon]|nr:PQQ-dependent sugar dehydrogenase [archaeon]